MRALVYKSTGSWYVVKAGSGAMYNARIKGRFKLDGITSTNPITVGDEIDIEPEFAVYRFTQSYRYPDQWRIYDSLYHSYTIHHSPGFA